jgi:hypothetical protein
MTVPTAAPIQHPPWCLRIDCADRGYHAGRALTAAAELGTDPVSVQLVQLLAPHTFPELLLTAGAVEAVPVTILQGRVLRRFLGRLVQQAQRTVE